MAVSTQAGNSADPTAAAQIALEIEDFACCRVRWAGWAWVYSTQPTTSQAAGRRLHRAHGKPAAD